MKHAKSPKTLRRVKFEAPLNVGTIMHKSKSRESNTDDMSDQTDTNTNKDKSDADKEKKKRKKEKDALNVSPGSNLDKKASKASMGSKKKKKKKDKQDAVEGITDTPLGQTKEPKKISIVEDEENLKSRQSTKGKRDTQKSLTMQSHLPDDFQPEVQRYLYCSLLKVLFLILILHA